MGDGEQRRGRRDRAAGELGDGTLDRLAWAVAAGASSACGAAVLMSASRPALAPVVALLAVGTVTLAVFLVTRRAREVAKAASLLGELARVEPESGLPGPRALWSDLARALEQSRQTQQPLAVLMVSLGELRELHHQRGIVAGQRLVRHAAQALQSTVIAFGGVAYRAHGQALVALLPATNEADAEALARRLLPALSLLARKNGGLVSLVAASAAATGGDLPEDVLLRAERHGTEARALAEGGHSPQNGPPNLPTRRVR